MEDVKWIELSIFKEMLKNGKVVKRKFVWDKIFETLENNKK